MKLLRRRPPRPENLRLDPSARLCPRFDSAGVARWRVAPRGQMGQRVVDDCAFEHQM